jgi:hypothetical protein
MPFRRVTHVVLYHVIIHAYLLSHAACTWTYAFRIYITRQSYAGGLASRTGDMRHAEYPQFDLLDDSVA